MKYERLSKINTKTIIISLIVIIIIGSVLVLNITKAKYRTTTSINIVNGTIKYSGGSADLSILAIYQQKEEQSCTDDNCYNLVNDIPTNGYMINTNKSYCTIPENENKEKNIVSYKNSVLSLNISKKGTKCYLYFDKGLNIKNNSKGELVDFNKTACNNDCGGLTENGIYETEDDFGTSYYYRGSVDNNFVKFGTDEKNEPIWWRIIRINGDGSIRLIYNGTGTSTETTGTTTYIKKQGFNNYGSSVIYVGYEYGGNNGRHGYGTGATKSWALSDLETWFSKNLLEEWDNGNGSIDTNSGFCNDRSFTDSSSAIWSEDMEDKQPNICTWVCGPFLRINNTENPSPTLKCSTKEYKNKDYFTYVSSMGITKTDGSKLLGTKSLTYPVGLITADEVSYAGGHRGYHNESYWLYTGEAYWTMSPAGYDLSCRGGSYKEYNETFYVNTNGVISHGYSNVSYGLRPVINLKSTTTFTGAGTIANPYIVS